MEWPATNQSSRTRRYFLCKRGEDLVQALAFVALGSGAPIAGASLSSLLCIGLIVTLAPGLSDVEPRQARRVTAGFAIGTSPGILTRPVKPPPQPFVTDHRI